jgi:cytochrome c553
MKKLIFLVGAMALAGAAACDQDNTKDSHAAAKLAPAKPVAPEAREMFNSRCATCHGTEGKGNGPAAAALNPKPRNYTDKTWQKSVTDEQIKKTIIMGGAAVGKSPIMPASPDLESNQAVLDGLIAIIRQYGS